MSIFRLRRASPVWSGQTGRQVDVDESDDRIAASQPRQHHDSRYSHRPTGTTFRKLGYCTQFDSFPRGLTGREFISSFLLVHGYGPKESGGADRYALERVSLLDAGDRKVAAYSKGMRQRIRLAQAIAHQPAVLILDEPLNGLDPMVRAETIALFRKLAAEGLHLIISSHILHEVDMMSDRVILLNNGYVVAEGNIHGVRDEMEEHPMQILIRCDKPSKLAAQVFDQDHVVEARLHDDRLGLFVKTRDADRFYLLLNRVVAEGEINIESVAPVDDDLERGLPVSDRLGRK